VAEFEAIAEFKQVKINVVQEDQLTVQMDGALANIVVSNLLRNALFHNKLGGEVNIHITNKG
jgi:signal transduction histidine kinase